jgi:hypothetical protein
MTHAFQNSSSNRAYCRQFAQTCSDVGRSGHDAWQFWPRAMYLLLNNYTILSSMRAYAYAGNAGLAFETAREEVPGQSFRSSQPIVYCQLLSRSKTLIKAGNDAQDKSHRLASRLTAAGALWMSWRRCSTQWYQGTRTTPALRSNARLLPDHALEAFLQVSTASAHLHRWTAGPLSERCRGQKWTSSCSM